MELNLIGKRVPLEDAADKVTGRTIFSVDINLPGMLHAKVLRSPHPHAKILKIDTSKAEALPGVEAVITHHDVPQDEWQEFSLNYLGRVLDDRVRFVGDEVAAVAAINEEIAEEAVNLIEVEYELLPHVFSIEEAAKSGAPLVCPHGNARDPDIIQWGNLELGFSESDLIVEGETRAGSQQHAPVGLNACIAHWEGDRLTMWTGTQSPHELRDTVARLLKMPMSKVRVLATPLGGSFGLFWTNNFHFLPVFLAKKAKKPVRLQLTREEIFATVKRREVAHTRVKLGLKRDGTFHALHVIHHWDNGGYGLKVNPYQANNDLWTHNVKHGKYEFQGISTNLLTAGCMRGVGDLTIGFCVERTIDEAAENLGFDPLEIRLKNHSRAGDPQRHDTTLYELFKAPRPEKELSSCGLDKCIERGAEAIGWKSKWKGWGKPSEVRGSKRRAVGMAVDIHICGQMNLGTPSVLVRVHQDGTVNLLAGFGRMGQGIETTQAQIAAEALGVPLERITGFYGDTAGCPWSGSTVGSENCHITGRATLAAALDAKRQVCEAASRPLGAKPEDIDVKDGIVFVKGQPEKSLTFEAVAGMAEWHTLCPPTIIGKGILNVPHSPTAKMFMAHFVEVEVDTDTGKVDILKYVAAHDSGRIINPSVCENQVVSGVLQGCGYALGEVLHFEQDTGQILNPNFVDYKILRMADVPDIKTIFVEEEDPVGPYGAKGIGEGTLCPCPTAIAQAIYNATGVGLDSMPFPPEAVYKATHTES